MLPPHFSAIAVKRIVLFSIILGVILATVFGFAVESSGHSAVNAPGSSVSVRPTLSPLGLGFGLLTGALGGALLGLLWEGGSSIRHGAAGLTVLVGAVLGLVVAAQFGAETTVTVSGNAVQVDHGASTPMIVAGIIAGLLFGGAVASALARYYRNQGSLSS